MGAPARPRAARYALRLPLGCLSFFTRLQEFHSGCSACSRTLLPLQRRRPSPQAKEQSNEEIEDRDRGRNGRHLRAGWRVHSETVVPNDKGGFDTITMDQGRFASASGDRLTITEGTSRATYKKA